MNAADIATALVGTRTHPTKVSAIDTVNCVFGMVRAALRRGEAVHINGFGSFTPKDVDEHLGTNPRTGEKIIIAARRRAAFKASKGLMG